MRPRTSFILISGLLIVCTAALIVPIAQRGPAARRMPGVEGGGVTLLPNGWRIAPAGRHLGVGDLPLAMVQSADGKYVIITNNGYAKPTLTVVELGQLAFKSRVTVDDAWLGLVWRPDGKGLYSSGAAQSTINEFDYADGTLRFASTLTLARAQRPSTAFVSGDTSGQQFIGGLAITPDGRRLFAAHVLGRVLSAMDVPSGRVIHSVDLAAEPYTCLVSADGKTVFVSLWGGAKVLMFDAATLEPKGDVAVGEHPNAMVLTKDGTRLFVACANTNAVWVVDLASRTAKEQISMALFPNAPAGTTPNGLGLSPDGKTLLVANADNNTVGVVDIERPGASQVEGFIPTGWYPTAAMFTNDGKQILVLSGKGLTSQANPRGNQPTMPGLEGQYSAAILQGTLSVLPVPDRETLAGYTKKVYALTPYSEATRLAPAGAPVASPIPQKVGGSSPITHVFYVIRENRTYDQILGDLPQGNGDPTLCLFGEDVTPNAHALAREFVLLDNFYVDAEVSYDGHAWSMGAYATDVVEKLWPTNYGRRGGVYLSEGSGAMRNRYGNLAAPADGYLWDTVKRAGGTVRSYGEFAEWQRDANGKITRKVIPSVPGLEGLVHPDYAPYDLSVLDNERVDVWLKDFRALETSDTLPQLSIIRLSNDHTQGTRPGAWTPRAMIAENDLALGRLVEAISTSRYWKESAIFVLEDDAQNGPDHVDAHRSPGFVISPFAKHGAVDSTLYTTSGMLRTIELILKAAPMSQFDAAATPMYNAFQTTPVLTPYAKRDARISLTEVNDKAAFGAQASLRMNLDEADLAPERELNEILWKSVRGAHSIMPPPVRAAFVRQSADKDDDKEKEERDR